MVLRSHTSFKKHRVRGAWRLKGKMGNQTVMLLCPSLSTYTTFSLFIVLAISTIIPPQREGDKLQSFCTVDLYHLEEEWLQRDPFLHLIINHKDDSPICCILSFVISQKSATGTKRCKVLNGHHTLQSHAEKTISPCRFLIIQLPPSGVVVLNGITEMLL